MNMWRRGRRIKQIYYHWLHKCGWCGGTHPVATNGRDLFCSYCGRWRRAMSAIYERGCKCPDLCAYHPTPNRPFMLTTVAEIGDELNQCLQIILTTAENMAGKTEKVRAESQTIIRAVDRAASAVRAL